MKKISQLQIGNCLLQINASTSVCLKQYLTYMHNVPIAPANPDVLLRVSPRKFLINNKPVYLYMWCIHEKIGF